MESAGQGQRTLVALGGSPHNVHMRRVFVAFALVLSACTATSTEVSTGTAPPTSAVTTTVSTTDAPMGTTTTTVPETTTSTLPPIDGTSLADVIALAEAELAARFELRDHPPGVVGPELLTCSNAESIPAEFGDVFACLAQQQTDDTVSAAPLGVVIMVLDGDGTARWLIGEGVPATAEELDELFAPHAGAHFCRELAGEAPYPLNIGYLGAMAY